MFGDGGYVEATLIKGEKVKVRANFHWVAWLWYYFIFSTLGVSALITFFFAFRAYWEQDIPVMCVFIVAGLILGFYPLTAYLELAMTEMVCTNRRVVCKTGIISIRSAEIKTEKLESIQIKQSFWGRLFGYGNICFSGTGTAKVEFFKVNNPWKVKAEIEEAIEESEREEKARIAQAAADNNDEESAPKTAKA